MALPPIPLILEELGGLRRVIFLAGSLLPREPGVMAFGTEVRGRTDWYPGSADPSSQILGPKEKPIRFSGRFEDRRIGAPATAQAQMLLLQDLVNAAHHVKCTYGPVQRICRWKSVDFTIHELQRIDYEVELEALRDAVPSNPIIRSILRSLPTMGLAVNYVVAAKDSIEALPVSLDPTYFADAITGIQNEFEEVEDAIQDLGQLSVRDRSTRVRGQIDKMDRTRAKIRAVRTKLGQIDVGQAEGLDDYTLTTEAGIPIASASSSLVRAEAEAQKVRLELETLSGDVLRPEIYVVSDGDTLQRIALAKYGDAAMAPELASANRLTDWTLVAGQQICLPRIPQRDKTTVP